MTPSSLFAVTVKAADITDKMVKSLGLTRNKIENILSNNKTKSLTKQIEGSISIFPVIMTNDIPVDAASIIASMLELEYANFLTIALSTSPRVNINDINDGKYLSKYHTNMNKLESVLEDSFDCDDFIESSMARSIIDATMESVDINRSTMNRLNVLKNESMEVKDSIYGLDWLMEEKNHSYAIGEYKKMRDRVKDRQYQDEVEYKHKRDGIKDRYDRIDRQYQHARDDKADERQDRLDREAREEREYRRTRDDKADERQNILDRESRLSSRIGTGLRISSEIRAWKDHIDRRRDRKEDLQREEERTQEKRISKEFSKSYNYKPVNDMQAVPVVANIFTVDDNGTPSRQIEVVSGVKSKIHPISKADFFSLMSTDEKGGFLAQLIRFTSGEIHFFRDIVLGTPTIKEYTSKMSKFHSDGAKILGILKRVKDLNRSGKDIKPNATLVVSKAAVEELKRKNGIDLLDEDEALDLCNELSIIKFIVSDPLGGKLHVLMPGMYDRFSVMSMNTLEKQVDAVQDAALTKEFRKILSKK